MDQQSLNEIQQMQEVYKQGGWVAVAALAIKLFLSLYRSDSVQSALGQVSIKFLWETWSIQARLLVVAVVSIVSAFLAGLAGGQTWLMALLGAVPAGLLAMGTHNLQKSVVLAASVTTVASGHKNDLSTRLNTKLPPT